MEAGGSFERRGSVISPGGFFDDHPNLTYFGNIGSPATDVVDANASTNITTTTNVAIPSISVVRHRGNSETQYAETEVIQTFIKLI